MASELVNAATSDKLPEVDWAKYIEICELVAGDQRQAKDVIKVIKKRLVSKSPNAQLYAVMLLEMLMNNIGEPVHKQVIEAGIISILVKIVKKKSDLPVREKIFLLLDATQTAVGGASGKFPQYYNAYYDLVSAGVKFPERHTVSSADQPASGGSQNTPTVTKTASTSEVRSMKTEEPKPAPGSSIIEKATAALEVLREVLDAVDDQNPEAGKDEFTLDLVEQCSFQKDKVMHLVMSSRDEKLVLRAIKLNEQLGRVLERHEALISHRPVRSASSVEISEGVIPTSKHNNHEGNGTMSSKYTNHVSQSTSDHSDRGGNKGGEEAEQLSHSIIDKAAASLEVLREVLDAVNAQNPEAAKDEFTLDLVEQCAFQKDRVMHLVLSSRNERLVLRAIELNEQLGRVLERHEAFVSNKPVESASSPIELSERVLPTSNHNKNAGRGTWASKHTNNAGQPTSSSNYIDHEDTEDEEEAEQLSRRIRKGKAHVKPEDEEVVAESPFPSDRPHRPLIRPITLESPVLETRAPPLATSIPPPPAKHVEREKFFKEKKGDGTPLAGHMRGLSLHSRNGSNSSFTGSYSSTE